MNPQELKAGDFFTVRKWTSHTDNSYKGDCLEAKVINYPFVRAYRHDGVWSNRVITLNLEQLEIMSLSNEFVESVIAKKAEIVDIAKNKAE